MSKHTPGPWIVGTDILENGGCRVVDPQDRSVCRVYQQKLDTWSAIANAYLIAAAPELLETLECLVKMVEDGDWTTVELNESRAAIAKARRCPLGCKGEDHE